MIFVVPVTRKVVAAVVPNLTDVTPMKLVPVMVTVVPPEVEPLVGVKRVMVGRRGNDELEAARRGGRPAGGGDRDLDCARPRADLVLAVILLVLVTVNDVAAVVPNLTDVAPVKLVPVMVTVVPPVV